MSDEQNQYMQDFERWQELHRQLGKIRKEEAELRSKLFNGAFPQPTEGSGNEFELPDGRIIKGNYKINRTVDKAALESSKENLTEKGIPVDSLIRYKPELALGEYKKLSKKDQKLMDSVLTIKPGTPELKII